jgi:hypothetical protein
VLESEADLAEETARAMRELAGTVTDAPPLRLTGRSGARLPRLSVPRRWTLWAVPLAAAAAVIALAVALVVVKDLPSGRAPHPTVPTYPSTAGVPAYYVAPETVCRKEKCDPTRLVVGNTLTGARLGTLSPPAGATFEAASAAADDRTFVTDTVGFPLSATAAQHVTWYLITIAPGSSTPVRRTRLLIPAGPTGAYVQSIALSASGRELAVAYHLGSRSPGTTVLRTYSITTGRLVHSWSTNADVQLGMLGYAKNAQFNNELSWVDGDRAITFTTTPSLSQTNGGTLTQSTDVRVLDVNARGDDLLADSQIVWSIPDRPGNTPAPAWCGWEPLPSLAANGKTVLCTSLTSTPIGTGKKARYLWRMTWLTFQKSDPKVVRTVYTATANEGADQAGITGGTLWADPSGSTMIIAWSEGVTDSGVTVEKTPHFGILSHGRLSQLPLPSIGPHAQSTLFDVSSNIAW